MDMPNLREDGYTIEMMPIDSAVAKAQVDANADTDNPEKTTLIDLSNLRYLSTTKHFQNI